VTFFKHAVYIL